MKLLEFEAGLAERLCELGFALDTADSDGPMGTGLVRYSSGQCDVLLIIERGMLAVTVGLPGQADFGYKPWADLLGLEVDAGLDADAQADFLLGHADQIEKLIERDPAVAQRLRSANWRYVKEYLGLDPDMPRPGASEGS
jgi:hypothetical protein